MSKRDQKELDSQEQNMKKRYKPICWSCNQEGHLRRNCSLKVDHSLWQKYVNETRFRGGGKEKQESQDQKRVTPHSITILALPGQITKDRLYRAVKEIVKGKRIENHSEDDLWSLISEIRYCNAAVEAKEGMAQDFWTTNVVRTILEKRCPPLRDGWSEYAIKIEKEGQEVTIEWFLEFLMEQARMMGSTFGMAAYEDD
jgi:hypothetical protein